MTDILAVVEDDTVTVHQITVNQQPQIAVQVPDRTEAVVSSISRGPQGLSAYDLAIDHGFEGTMDEWLLSLRGIQGKSAYDLAVENGFSGDVAAWLASLEGPAGDTGVGIDSVVRTSGDGSPGTIDTYTITYTDGSTSTFPVANGANGSAASVTPAAVAATLSDSAVKTPLDAEINSLADLSVGKSKSRVRPVVRNRTKLSRFSTALAAKTAPVITIVGNSISHGVGSDGSTSTTTGFYDTYRQYAWPVLLRKGLAREGRFLPGDDFVPPGSYYSITTTSGTATRSASVAAFGSLSGGGLVLNASTASADFPAAKMSKFTQVDVYYYGTAAGVSGYSPRVLVDDVEKYAGGVVSSGNISVISITGLTDASHKVTVQGTGTANGCFVLGIVVRRSSIGTVVNRVAMPGAKASDVLGDSGFTTQQKNRNIDAAVLAGYSDLVILAMTANEVYAQQPLATYQDAVQQIITRATSAGACVLLVGDPAVNGEETGYAIKGSDYRGVLKTLSDTNSDVAYADFNEVFGDRSVAASVGLFDPGGSVHPMLEGHRRMADFIQREVLPGATLDTAVASPTAVTGTALLLPYGNSLPPAGTPADTILFRKRGTPVTQNLKNISAVPAALVKNGAPTETFNASGMTVSYAAGQMYLFTPPFASDHYTIELGINSQTAGTMFGLVVVDGTGKGMAAAWYNSPSGLLTLGVTSYAYNSTFVNGGGTPTYPSRIRLQQIGTAVTTSYSTDGGATWSPYGGAGALAAGYVPTKVGFGSISGSGSAQVTDFIYSDANGSGLVGYWDGSSIQLF